LKSTSCKDIAREVLEKCLAGAPPRELPPALCADPCGDALFGVLAEGLADRFEPALCDAYAKLFSQAIACVREDVDAGSLASHYQRMRKPRPVAGEPRTIFVLSRVTLGADIAVTSVLITAAKKRFPHSEIVFVGPRKNYELFAAAPQLHHAEIGYCKGGLRQRLAVWDQLRELLDKPESIVIDPDSRFTQLGLLPVCAEERYHLFDSRSYQAETSRSLPELASAWALEIFGVAGARPFVALGPAPEAGHIAVSFGVGENPAKRLPESFEEELLKLLSAEGRPICIDKGAGGEEAERVMRAVERSGVEASLWEGSFAGFARIISGAALYAGYDSAGQHVAAACGVPLISVFAGFPAPRMFDRWKPSGPRCDVIRVDRPDAVAVLQQVTAALAKRKASNEALESSLGG
jgi:ADP-heptose:LPS heptosyltransferase